MFTLITPQYYDQYQDELKAMFALRYRVFCERLGWVKGDNGMERDHYDHLGPAYIIYQDKDGEVLACVRLLPTTGPNMLRDTFPQLMDGRPAPAARDIWESSRFSVDTQRIMSKNKNEISVICMRLILAIVEFGFIQNLSKIFTVTDLRVERLVQRSGWQISRLGSAMTIGNVQAVAIIGKISPINWNNISKRAKVSDHILFQPEDANLKKYRFG